MFGFGRLKRIWKLSKKPPTNGSFEELPTIAELAALFEEHTQDLSNINTALQRIERKQNRWIEMLNLKSVMREPGVKETGVTAVPEISPARPLVEVLPGQIVD